MKIITTHQYPAEIKVSMLENDSEIIVPQAYLNCSSATDDETSPGSALVFDIKCVLTKSQHLKNATLSGIPIADVELCVHKPQLASEEDAPDYDYIEVIFLNKDIRELAVLELPTGKNQSVNFILPSGDFVTLSGYFEPFE